MNLLGVRKKFVELSGRYDLVADPASFTPDNGANFFIQAGQRFLDNIHENQLAWYKRDLSAGQAVIDVKFVKSVREVWVADGEGRSMLTRVSLSWLRENFGKPVASLDKGAPLYYAIAVNKLAPEQAQLTLGAGANSYTTQFTYGFEDIIFSDELGGGYQHSTVLIAPPTDSPRTVEVLGQFFSKKLEADQDVNFWTEQYPELLIKSSLYELETFYRNSEGAKDWLSAVEFDLVGLDKNIVEDLQTDIYQREG